MRIDRRVIKTRTNIKFAFMSLMLEKDLASISVSDIASKADINRSTFYLHYASIEDVMVDIENTIAKTATECFDGFDIKNLRSSTFRLLKRLSESIEDPRWRNYILFSTISSQIQRRIKDIFIDKALDAYKIDFPEGNYTNALLLISYAVGGIFDSYVKWALAENAQLTLEDLIVKLCKTSEIVLSKLI